MYAFVVKNKRGNIPCLVGCIGIGIGGDNMKKTTNEGNTNLTIVELQNANTPIENKNNNH